MTQTSYNLELYIDKLVLHGFPKGDRDRIHTAIQLELSRLFTEHGLPHALSQETWIDRMNGGSVAITSKMKEGAIGTQIAQSIYGKMGG